MIVSMWFPAVKNDSRGALAGACAHGVAFKTWNQPGEQSDKVLQTTWAKGHEALEENCKLSDQYILEKCDLIMAGTLMTTDLVGKVTMVCKLWEWNDIFFSNFGEAKFLI